MSDCGYVYIENWEKFQHSDAVRSTNMPWFKTYTDLLGNDDWLDLTPADRTLLQGLWMLTGRYGLGRVRADSGWLNAQLKIRKGSLERLSDAGFITIRASKGARDVASTIASLEREEREKRIKPIVDRGRSTTWPTVWSAYTEHHPTAKPTTKRKRLLAAREKEGFDEPTLLAAVQGNHADPWCNGENRDGKQYHAFELIFRDAAKVEQYAAIGQNGNGGETRMERANRLLAEQGAAS